MTRIWWLPTGALNAEQHWVDGLPHGTWRGWFPNGKPRTEQSFENGVCVRGREWDEAGALVADFEGPQQDMLADDDWLDEADPEGDDDE